MISNYDVINNIKNNNPYWYKNKINKINNIFYDIKNEISIIKINKTMINLDIKNYEDVFKLAISYIIGKNDIGFKNIFNYLINIYKYYKINNPDNYYYNIFVDIINDKNIDLPSTKSLFSLIFKKNINENNNLEKYFESNQKNENNNILFNNKKNININNKYINYIKEIK
jgi:hypothetical protein